MIKLLRTLLNTKSPMLSVGLFCLLLLAACEKATNPDDVAVKFWEGLSEYDLEQATEYSTADSPYLFNESMRNASFQIGRVDYDCDGATVATYISRGSEGAGSNFITFLVRDRVADQWKVDYPRTVLSIDTATDKRFKNIVAVTKDVKDEVKKKVQFKPFFKQLWQAVKDAFNELKARFLRKD